MEQVIQLLQAVPNLGWAGALIAVAALVAAIVLPARARKWQAEAERTAELARLRAVRKLALDDGRLDDAEAATVAIKALGAFLLILACLAAPGCRSTPDTVYTPAVIGQRWLMPNPGDVVTVPPLSPPARQWFLVDSVALERLALPAK